MTEPLAPHPRGGLYFEDFVEGSLFRHRLTRTVTQTDNMLFSNMTLNPQPLHIDAHFCATGDRVGPALDELALHPRADDRHLGERHHRRHHHRQSRHDGRAVPGPAVRGRHDQLHHGGGRDPESKSRPDAGIVDFIHRAFKQDGTLVAECRRQAFMRKRPAA
jgi:acyl dehydratase